MADQIRTESDLKNNIFPDNQAVGSITAQDMRDLVASTRYLQPLGWEFKFDSDFEDPNPPVSGTPLTLLADTPTKVTFSANPGEDLRYPSTFPEIWNNTTQKLEIPTFLNGFGIIRLSCWAEYSGSQPHVDFTIDVGSDPELLGGSDSNVIYDGASIFAKGSGVPQAHNWVVPLFGGSDFVTNGATFIITSHGGASTAWQFTLTAGAIMVPNPAGEG